MILGHRGGNLAPENSLAAVKAAVAAGADGAEIDVQLTRSDRLVLQHDAAERGVEAGVDQLPDFLRDVPEAVTIVLDVKVTSLSGDELAKRIVKDLENRQVGSRVVVSSFSLRLLRQLRDLDSSLELYPIVSLHQNFFTRLDHEEWSGISVLAAALVMHPLLLRHVLRGGRFLVWFGATEWTWLALLMRRLGAEGLIVKDVRRWTEATTATRR